ncbi:MAG: metalloregulator ArsR/SmtB family transcription factor [Planctomycetota bacterium]
MAKYEPLDLAFAALASPVRRLILERLRDGPRPVGEVAAPLGLANATVSKHVRVLEEAGLIERERDGRVHRLRLGRPAIELATSWLDEHARFWKGSLDRLQRVAEAEQDRVDSGMGTPGMGEKETS